MIVDIVFPNDDETEFVSIASKLGYNGLCFVYKFDKNKIEKYKELVEEKQKNTKLRLYLGILANFNEINKAIKYADLVLVGNSEKNREVLEKSKADVLFDLETQDRKDFLHQRASGLNHILCSLANKNKKIIGFSFCSVLSSKNKAQMMGRMSQNIMLCRKYNVMMAISSFAADPYQMRAPKDLMSFFIVLGMHQKEAKDALDFL